MPPAPLPSTVPHFGDLDNWTGTTFYAPGQRVLNGANIYQCVTQGTSAGAGGPVGGGAGIVDGSVTWDFVCAASPPWAPLTTYARGDIVTNDGGKLYQALNALTSAGAGGPTGTGGVIPDATMIWTYVGTIIGQRTTPTSRTADVGNRPGAPFFAQYRNWFDTLVTRWIYYLRDLADQAWTWTGAHEFVIAPTFDAGATTKGIIAATATAAPIIEATDNPSSAYRLIFAGTNAAGTLCRWYETGDGGTAFTTNAGWSVGGSAWIADDTASDASMMLVRGASGGGGGATLKFKANGMGASWADGAWDATSTETCTTGTTRTFDGPVAAERFRAKGTALAVTDFALDANWGNTATVEQVYGCDGAWNVKVKANGAGIGADPTITLTYKDGTWGTSPVSIIKFTNSDDAAVSPDTTDVKYTTPSPSATAITFTLKGTPTGGKVYFFAGIVIGL